MPLEIKHKLNVHKTYVRRNYQSKLKDKNTITDTVFESLLLTLKEIERIFQLFLHIVNFEPVFVYWANSEYYFLIQNLRQ